MPMGGGRGIHDDGVRLHPGSGYGAAHGTGGNADTWMTAYPFHLPSIREGVDIQDALIFSKPYRGLDWRPVGFDHGVGHSLCFCTTQKHLAVKRSRSSMTYAMIPSTPL